jgi:hypothetical protein
MTSVVRGVWKGSQYQGVAEFEAIIDGNPVMLSL